MGNIKNCQKINYFFLSHKKFLKRYYKPISHDKFYVKKGVYLKNNIFIAFISREGQLCLCCPKLNSDTSCMTYFDGETS